MHTLIYAPDQATYSLQDGSDRLKSEVSSVGKFRRALMNEIRLLDVTWQCSEAIYNYLTQAYRAFVNSGGDPFLCNLILDDANIMETFETRFINGSFGLTSINGKTYNVKAQFIVLPKQYDTDVLPIIFGGDLKRVGISVDTGIYALSGKAIEMHPSRVSIFIEYGSYFLTGRDASLSRSPLETGTYNLTGNAITFTRSAKLETGQYNLSGQDVTLTQVT